MTNAPAHKVALTVVGNPNDHGVKLAKAALASIGEGLGGVVLKAEDMRRGRDTIALVEYGYDCRHSAEAHATVGEHLSRPQSGIEVRVARHLVAV